ncbi:MAG: hypothetical protein H6838_11145 [Planctomycetes bacterium]|nr:hypothetical protein [Planctomycetota bacterium]
MVEAHRTKQDAQPFVGLVEATASGILALYHPESLRLVHVDNWFGPKWLSFSAKVAGGVAIWMDEEHLTLPPFVPGRILTEQCWVLDRPSVYRPVESPQSIHVSQCGGANLSRLASREAPGQAIVWYSGNTVSNQRGAIMAYVPARDAYRTWYVELDGGKSWGMSKTRGTSRDDFEALLAGKAV